MSEEMKSLYKEFLDEGATDSPGCLKESYEKLIDSFEQYVEEVQFHTFCDAFQYGYEKKIKETCKGHTPKWLKTKRTEQALRDYNDIRIIEHAQKEIPYSVIEKLIERVKNTYYFSAPKFWMVKMFQVGFAYGKRAERRKNK